MTDGDAPKTEEPTTAASTATEVKEVKKEMKKVIVHPNENAQGFIESIAKPQAKKVAYQVLDWVNKLTGKTDAPVPGNADKQETSSKDFMQYLKDGALLAKLANVLQPNSVKTVHESTEKDKQMENIKNFLNFVKEKAGLGVADTVKAEDVQAGKTSAFGGLLATLVALGGKATESFGGAQGLDLDGLLKTVQDFVPKSFLQTLLALKDRLFKPRPAVAHAASNGKEEKKDNTDNIPNVDAESPVEQKVEVK